MPKKLRCASRLRTVPSVRAEFRGNQRNTIFSALLSLSSSTKLRTPLAGTSPVRGQSERAASAIRRRSCGDESPGLLFSPAEALDPRSETSVQPSAEEKSNEVPTHSRLGRTSLSNPDDQQRGSRYGFIQPPLFRNVQRRSIVVSRREPCRRRRDLAVSRSAKAVHVGRRARGREGGGQQRAREVLCRCVADNKRGSAPAEGY